MKYIETLRLLFSRGYIVLILSSLISCKDESPVSNDSGSILFPENGVSYARHIQPLFQRRCAFSGCHGGSSPAAGLDLTTPSYHNLMNHQPRLVTSGEPQNSLLVQRIEGTILPRMPLNSQPLTENQIRGIRTWIQEGAANN